MMINKMQEVQIYTDGACSGNPGPGGYSVILQYGSKSKEISGGFRLTTNNRMELTSVIIGLQELKKPCSIKLYSDSKYIVDAMNLGWVRKWMANGWLKSDKSPVKNIDLWKQLLALLEPHSIEWIWVKGHANNVMNSRCDQLAVEACQGKNLQIDCKYENENR